MSSQPVAAGRFTGQAGIATYAQLARAGIGHDVVRSQIRARRWQRIAHRVVALHNGPLSVLQRQWVAVLAQPAGGVLSGLSAAAHYGLRGFDESSIDVLVRHGSRHHTLTGVRVHLSRLPIEEDVHPTRRPPMVRVERALVDAATWSSSARLACGILAAGVQQRLTTAVRLGDRLASRSSTRHIGVMRLITADIEGGAQSLAEIDMGTLCRRAGLPAPRRQVVRHDSHGRRRYLDVDCGGFSVEVDGGFHMRPLNWIEDSLRQNELVLTGHRVLRVPSVLIRVAPEVVIEQLRRAAQRFGSEP